MCAYQVKAVITFNTKLRILSNMCLVVVTNCSTFVILVGSLKTLYSILLVCSYLFHRTGCVRLSHSLVPSKLCLAQDLNR
jgi:hypothetical protein